MGIDSLSRTALDTAVTTGVLINDSGLDLQGSKAMILALATSVIVQLTIKGLKFLVSKISKKDKNVEQKSVGQPKE